MTHDDLQNKNAIFTKISLISKLKKDWNGYGADAPSQEICDIAISLTNLLPPALQQPFICPFDGGIQFEWQNKKDSIVRDLEIEIGLTDFGFLCAEGDDMSKWNEGEFPVGSFCQATVDKLNELFNWILFWEVYDE